MWACGALLIGALAPAAGLALPAAAGAPPRRACLRRPRWVGGGTRMAVIEAYDLVPMLTCLDGTSGVDEVFACFGTLSPWLRIADGNVVLSEFAIAGFIGGSVGAIGTLIATNIKRGEVKERLNCPYCEGTCAPPPPLASPLASPPPPAPLPRPLPH